MKEFLIIGNSVELKHIDASEICYITADGNSSYIYLTSGEKIHVLLKIGHVFEKIQTCLPYYKKGFYMVGRSLIINKINLSYMNVSKQLLIFSDKRSDTYLKGYTTGYAAGYSDGRLGEPSFLPPDINVGRMILQYKHDEDQESEETEKKPRLPKERLKELMERITKDIIKDE